MKKNIIIISFIITAILLFLIIYYQKNNSVSYQLNKLAYGNSKQKIMAADFMGKKKINSAIPLLVSYINSDEWFLYKGKAPWTLSCISTLALNKITNKNLGDTCDGSKNKTDEQINQIKQSWQNWYQDEYLKK